MNLAYSERLTVSQVDADRSTLEQIAAGAPLTAILERLLSALAVQRPGVRRA
jgi:hypothetical protein